jgi:hypothetical protein
VLKNSLQATITTSIEKIKTMKCSLSIETLVLLCNLAEEEVKSKKKHATEDLHHCHPPGGQDTMPDISISEESTLLSRPGSKDAAPVKRWSSSL